MADTELSETTSGAEVDPQEQSPTANTEMEKADNRDVIAQASKSAKLN
jgi:hypothetical protein